MRIYSHLLEIAKDYKGILTDAYGVFWNGSGFYKGCLECFSRLKADNKYVVILSNATASGDKEEEKYGRHGLVRGEHYDRLITSGDVTRAIFQREALPFPTPRKKFWVLGGEHPKFGSPHKKIFEGSEYIETPNIQEADFIYIGIPHLHGEDQTEASVFQDSVKRVVATGLPMLCANPDKVAQEGTPPRWVVRQGSIAAIYELLGGKVYYIGKPCHDVYRVALDEFETNAIEKSDILMVGDNIETDIAGANNNRIDSALIYKTGMASLMLEKKSLEEFAHKLESHYQPTYWVATMGKP